MDVTSKFWLTLDAAKRIIQIQEHGALTPNHHIIAIQLIDMGLLGMDGWRYMPVEEARECWQRCHK